MILYFIEYLFRFSLLPKPACVDDFFFFEKVLKCFRLALHPHPHTSMSLHRQTCTHRHTHNIYTQSKRETNNSNKNISSRNNQIHSEAWIFCKTSNLFWRNNYSEENFARQWKRIEGPGATKRLKQQSTLVDIRNVLKVANTGYPGNCESTSGTYAQQCNLFYNYESFLAECHLCVILCKHVPETGGHCLHQSKECFVFSFPGFPYFPTPPDFQLHPHPPPSLPTPTPASELWPHSRVQGEEAAALC